MKGTQTLIRPDGWQITLSAGGFLGSAQSEERFDDVDCIVGDYALKSCTVRLVTKFTGYLLGTERTDDEVLTRIKKTAGGGSTEIIIATADSAGADLSQLFVGEGQRITVQFGTASPIPNLWFAAWNTQMHGDRTAWVFTFNQPNAV
jgi:hypothetical protein